MSLQYKAYLYEDRVNKPKEIRRFTVDEGVSSSYEYLRRKVASVFPNLSENFALQWRDNDGDLISYNSDEELMQALTQLSEEVFCVYIKQNPSTPSNDKPCGSQYQWPGGFGGFSTWVPPINPFFPNENKCSFFQQQQKTCRKPADISQQTSEKPSTRKTSASHPRTQGSSCGDDYLQHVGNAVADFLQPFGINVDINVQHKSNRVMCPGTKKHQQNFETSEQATSAGDHKYKAQTGTSSNGPEGTDWTFLKKDNDKLGEEVQGEDAQTMETDEGTKLKEGLARLLEMGFNDNGGWLTNLLTACNYNISRVLEAMQPARDQKL